MTSISDNNITKQNNLEELMKINYTYPNPSDPEFQYKIYKKREFYYHKIPPRPNINNYNDIKEYRDNICARQFTLHEHQAMLGNFINPNTPYKGVLIFHGLGTGKCITRDNYVIVNSKLILAEDIWRKYSSNIIVDDENGEWSIPNQKLYVNSLNDDGNIIIKQVDKLYREKVKTKIKKIILENGYELKITQIHRLYVNNKWTNNFSNDDYVAIPKKLINKSSNNKLIQNDLLYIIILYLSHKTDFNNNIINLYLDNHEKAENIEKRIKSLENSNIFIKNNYLQDSCICQIILNSKDYIDLIEKIIKDNREIPDYIMDSNLTSIEYFLEEYLKENAILKADNVEICCKSRLISKQINYLLKLFGIDSHIKHNNLTLKIKHSNMIILNGKISNLINLKQLQSEYCQNESNKDIIYVKIKSIEDIDYEDYVYDLEILDTHNYIAEGILCHNTCAAISIAEKFKDMVQRYNTKIYVLVSGPLIRENWKNELLTCTGETYLKYQDKSIYVDENEKIKAEKNAIANALQYYRFMSYRSFYKRVLGEKIVDRKVVQGSKVRVSYRKTEEGEFERDIAVDRIYNLNNSVVIVDEAHNLTGNAYGEALKLIINNSSNMRLVLLSATPMKNLADDIIELLNFLRPIDSQIERDKIFTTNKIHLMEIKPGGLEYLKNMAQGYVSHVRGADPLIFAKRVDKGEIPPGLLFTKVIRCKMGPFQKKIYNQAIELIQDDSLDRKSSAVANFAFPALSQDRNKLIGVYGREGINTVRNQIRSNYHKLNKKIAEEIINDKDESDLITITDNEKTISGKIFNIKYLKYFSIKFYTALLKLNQLVWGKKGTKTAFIYSNLVKVGIELFQEILIQNGYLEFQENASNYQIKSDTVCYFCGKTFSEHQEKKIFRKNNRIDTNVISSDNNTDSEDNISEFPSDTNKDIDLRDTPLHEFRPATFIAVTGKSTEESAEYIPEDKQRILKSVFSHLDNKEGKYIKFVLGSKVMNEGISLKNVGEVHILDVYFNLGKVDQTIGRAIRQCSHYKLMNEMNKFPNVDVYKYVVSLENELTSEELLYQKAESKYLLIKKVERALKEIAIDCPLNVYGNMFKEEIEQFKDCDEKGNEPCPAICDYTKCNYKCDDLKLNAEYYDPNRKIYKKVLKEDLDYSTFTNSLARSEIDYSKKKIKEMYIKKYVYTIGNIIDYVKNSYNKEKRDLFDEFFVFKALDELIPITENDFNNYKDTILDKYNRSGYLIYRNKYYIFQPFDQNEDVPMYYRTSFNKLISKKLSLYNYLRNTEKFSKYKGTKIHVDSTNSIRQEPVIYNFDYVMDYYDNRNEFKYVGIIDKELSRRKSKRPEELRDVFKIRERRAKILDKKRGTGIPSLKGAVCSTSKNKEYLENIAKVLNIEVDVNETRDDICNKIKNKMLELEKHSKGKNKLTYVIIPSNHPIYPFPYNLEDRVEYILNKIKNQIKYKLNIDIKQKKNKKDTTYIISIKDNARLNEFINFLKSLGAKKVENEWIINID